MRKAVVFPLLVLLLLSGCVSQGAFDAKAREADLLSSQIESLQAEVISLTTEINALKNENEQQKEELQKEKDGLLSRIEDLSEQAEKAEQLEKATQTYQDLTKQLEKEIEDGQVLITEMKNRLTMTLVDKIIFPSGSSKISKEGKKVLNKVVSILKNVKDKRIQIEGHTDNVQIVSAIKKKFPTNWELSTARATEVVRYLQENGEIDPRLLSATGYSEYQPIAPNETDEGKHKNRRIEIVLLPLGN